jgi:hypothetical protein
MERLGERESVCVNACRPADAAQLHPAPASGFSSPGLAGTDVFEAERAG